MAVIYVSAKPGVAPIAYTAPVVAAAAPAAVVAHSAQVVSRNYHGFAAPLASPYVAAAYTAPIAAAYASPYAAHYASPYASPLIASPYATYY